MKSTLKMKVDSNVTGFKVFTIGQFRFERCEYFAYIYWPLGSHMMPVDAFLRATMRDIAWGFFYGTVNFDDVIGTNLRGAFLVCKAFARAMAKARTGRIINIGSVVGLSGNAGQANYAASKGAVDTFTLGLAKEVATEGIRVNAVRPGVILTDIHDTSGEIGRVERVAPLVPMQRAGTAEEVAASILWLVSDEASYVTATFIEASGGR